MIPRKVVLENFLSFGTPAAAIEFADDEPLWVLCGPNGVGKSAVFDAITYALFGCHRGGKGQGMDALVRHGANGFRLEFEFGCGGREYRVVRNYGKKSVEKVYRGGPEKWVEIDLPAGKNRVREWAERELGLTFEQFTASVLLRQGEADRIITATGKDRLVMLKQIIGVERYERLSKRVGQAAKAADARKAKATADLARVPAVTPDELATAVIGEREAEATHAAARAEAEAAAGRILQAGEYARLSAALAAVTRQLDAAAARRAEAARIRADHGLLCDLDCVLPTLAKLIPARDARARCAPEVERLTAAEDEDAARVAAAVIEREDARTEAAARKLGADEAATALRGREADRKADATALQVAEEVEGLDRSLAGFTADLDEQLRTATAEVGVARAAAAEARDAHVAARTELKHREKELTDFGGVEAGAVCSRCRQPVTAEHAEAERRTLEEAVVRLRAGQQKASAAEAAATARQQAAEAAQAALDRRRRERDKLADHRLVLTRHGPVEAAADVRAGLADHDAEIARLTAARADEQAKGTAADARAKTAEARRLEAEKALAATQARLREARDAYTKADSTVAALSDTLSGEWAGRWETLAAVEVAALGGERDRLKAAGVADDFRALGEDDALNQERERQRDDHRAAIDALPDAARVPESDAKAAAAAARRAAEDAAAARDEARRALEALHRRTEERARLVGEERAAEADARAHATLDRLLGADGLQRELVRTAERQIVRFADETVRALSDGDLSIELDDAEDGPDKAFTLRVRRADDPTPIGVHYLSGSQKFRVAVAVALGIGRFATAGTQARPLESVIIDEGFGSLDKDGLRCMADELHRLKDKLALKRLVLVSHQDEFVTRFPVGWRLSRGESGTTAERFRR